MPVRVRLLALLLPFALAACAAPPAPSGVAVIPSVDISVSSPQAGQRITSNTVVVRFVHRGFTDLRCRAADQAEVAAQPIDANSATCTVNFGSLANGRVGITIRDHSTVADGVPLLALLVVLDRGANTGDSGN